MLGADNQQERLCSSLPLRRILRDDTPDSDDESEKIESDLHGDMQRVAEMSALLRSTLGRSDNRLSEIPCRVSSDLHEWRNESATVLMSDTANL